MALYDHLQDAKWIWAQSLGKKMPRALFEVLALGMNLAEEAFEFIRTKLNIVDATGVYLEQLGAKWGVARMGLDDDELRRVIIAEAASLFGSGDPGVVVRLIRQLVGAGPSMKVVEKKFHTFLVYLAGEISPQIQTLLGQVLEDVPALTINGQIVTVDKKVLTYSSVHGPVAITGGFGSAHGPVTDAAGFAHVIQL